MRKQDLYWLLAFPIYYLVNSFRHEMAHALSATLEGARLLALTFWPSLNNEGGIYWGGALWQGGHTTWMTAAMPYLFDLATFLLFFALCMAVPFQKRWMWLNLVVIGLVSPLLNSGIGYFLLNDDMRVLMQAFPPLAIDLYFIATLTFYLAGLALVFLFSRTVLPSLPTADMEDSESSITVTGLQHR